MIVLGLLSIYYIFGKTLCDCEILLSSELNLESSVKHTSRHVSESVSREVLVNVDHNFPEPG